MRGLSITLLQELSPDLLRDPVSVLVSFPLTPACSLGIFYIVIMHSRQYYCYYYIFNYIFQRLQVSCQVKLSPHGPRRKLRP